MRQTSTVTALALMACTSLPALAGEMEAKSTIDAVAVYPDAALVSRIVEADLPAGSTSLVFKNLPVGLDPNSLRVTGESAGGLAIGAVEARVAAQEIKPVDNAAEARLKILRGEREAMQVTLAALQAKLSMIQRFASVGPEKLSPDAKPLEIAQWGNAFDTIASGLAKTGEELRLATLRTREIDEDIRLIEISRQAPPAKASPAREVSVALEAGAAGKARLTLTYRIAGAGWRPLYDARLDTGGAGRAAALELVRRASVTQRTGEDWNDVALSVSTTRTQRGIGAPDMQPLRVGFYEVPLAMAPPAPMTTAQMPGRAKIGDKPDANAMDAIMPAAPVQLEKAREQQASLDAGAYQVAFQVPGRISVSTDGAAKTFRLASRQFNPSLQAKAVPALDETAYLEAHFINDEAVPLLPGQVNIFRDGTYAGTGKVALVAPGDGVDLGFGADDRVKVTRVPVKRKENEPTWFGQTKTEVREFKTVVKNLHDFTMKVAIVDQIPFSENSAIVVELQPATTAATDKSVSDKRGVMGWSYDMAAGETKEIRLAYKMKWPADHDVVFQAVPNGS